VERGLITRLMPAGVPSNMLGNVDNELSGPAILDNDTYAHLSTFAEEENYGQALTMAAQQSQTDMLKSVPTQNVTLDTRSTRWTITAASDGLSDTGNITANLASALCVKLNTTRVRGQIQMTFPATVADTNFIVAPIFPLQGFYFGLNVGSNSTSIQDEGTSQDQPILLSMEIARKDFHHSKLIRVNHDNADMRFNPVTPNNLTVPLAGGTVIVEFEFRPTCPLFACEKVWPPSIPLKMKVNWNVTTMANLFTPLGGATRPTITTKIYDIISDEIQLNPILTSHLQASFMSAPTTNMDLMLKSMRNGSPANELFDETFGIGGSYDISKIAAIYQFPQSRLSSHSIAGSSFDIHPVMNGSARPAMIVIAMPGAVAAGVASSLYATNVFTSLQILYDGRTVYDQPLLPFQMYSETLKSVNSGFWTSNVSSTEYYQYDSWNSTYSFIVLKTGPSHNEEDIQPARSTQLEIRASYATLAGPSTVRVGLFFDQTLLVLKNNTVVSSLPIF
jgi:hypothetical protein